MRAMPSSGHQMHLIFGIAVVATLLALISTLQAGFWLGHLGESVPWRGLLRARLVDWYCYGAFFTLLYGLARRFPVTGRGWERALALHVAASFPLALAKEALFVSIGNWVRPGVFDLLEILSEDYGREVLVFWALGAVAHAILLQRAPAAETERPAIADPGENRFVVRGRGRHHLIPVADVLWIEAQGNYACLNTRSGRFLIRRTMAALEQRLAPNFVRVHRGKIVNVTRIERIERRSGGGHQIILEGGTRIGSGRAYAGAIRRLIAQVGR